MDIDIPPLREPMIQIVNDILGNISTAMKFLLLTYLTVLIHFMLSYVINQPHLANRRFFAQMIIVIGFYILILLSWNEVPQFAINNLIQLRRRLTEV